MRVKYYHATKSKIIQYWINLERERGIGYMKNLYESPSRLIEEIINEKVYYKGKLLKMLP